MANRSVTVSIPHRLTQDEARRRLQEGLAKMRQQYAGKIADVHDAWNGNHLDLRLAIMGQTISGRMDVEPSVVKVEVDLPWILAAFADRLRPQIEAEGRKMLEQK